MDANTNHKNDTSQVMTPKQNAWQAAKFAMFSASAGVVEIITFTLMNELTELPYWPCYLTALVLSVVYNFTVNRRYTFKSVANIPKAMLKIIGFYCVFTPVTTYLGNMADVRGVNEYIILGVTMAFNLTLEYLFCRFVVYRGTMNTNKLAKKSSERTDKEA